MAATNAGAEKLAALAGKILACLEKGIDVVPLIKVEVGMNRCAVDNCLRQMEIDGKVHPIKKRNPKGGYINRWIAGPGEDFDMASDFDQPKIIRTPASANYPVIGRRDPLVAAIHGPANRYAARCTACGMEQGAGHLRNCIVQLVAA